MYDFISYIISSLFVYSKSYFQFYEYPVIKSKSYIPGKIWKTVIPDQSCVDKNVQNHMSQTTEVTLINLYETNMQTES